MSTLFTRIIRGEIPCHKIYEDADYFAFLDIRPIAEGHTLLVPKVENDRLFDLPEHLLAGLLPAARPIARALEKVVSCQRVGLMVAGLEVPHTHLHLVPMRDIGDLNFANATASDPSTLAALAQKIRSAIEAG